MNFSNETKVKDIALQNRGRDRFWRVPEWIIAAGEASRSTTRAHTPRYPERRF